MNNETIALETETSKATGPTTPEGKAASSRNAVKEGLYTRDAYIRPGEEDAYQDVIDRIFTDLLPEGALEMIFASEIVNATWRLRRCGIVEGNLADQTLIDPMEDEAFEKKQRAIDRARAQAHNIIRRSLSELRKLQTERSTRRELEVNHEESVLVDFQQVARHIEAKVVRDEKWQKRLEKAQKEELESLLEPVVPMPSGSVGKAA